MTEYGGQKGAVAAPGQQPPRGCRRQAWRCAAVGLAATAPRPRPRRRTGTRPTGHSREPSDRRHRNLAARRLLDRLTGPPLQAQRSTQQLGRGSACVLEARGAAAPRPGRPGPRRACAAVNSCAKSNSAAGFELSLRTWFSKERGGNFFSATSSLSLHSRPPAPERQFRGCLSEPKKGFGERELSHREIGPLGLAPASPNTLNTHDTQ